MSAQRDEFSHVLPHELIRRAYESSGELAWTRKDAIDATAQLEKQGYTILRIEVWIPSPTGPQMTGRYWKADDKARANRSQSAQDFLTSFEWGAYDNLLISRIPYFNLTAATP